MKNYPTISLFLLLPVGVIALSSTVYRYNGNYGIGTTTPSQLLTVGDNNQFTVTSAGAVDATSLTLDTDLDISADTNLTAGRSLTMSADSVVADVELYTDNKCLYFEDPVAADDFKSIWRAPQAVTITEVWAESDQTVNFDLQEDDGSPADILGTDLSPAAGEASTTTISDAAIASESEIDLVITSVSGTPTWVSICWTYTKND